MNKMHNEQTEFQHYLDKQGLTLRLQIIKTQTPDERQKTIREIFGYLPASISLRLSDDRISPESLYQKVEDYLRRKELENTLPKEETLELIREIRESSQGYESQLSRLL